MIAVPPWIRAGKRSSQGAILLEVLMATGFISILGVFLLSLLFHARRIDTFMTDGMDDLRRANRLFDLLKSDLALSKAILLEDGSQEEEWTPRLTLLVGTRAGIVGAQSTIVRYGNEGQEGNLTRSEMLPDGSMSAIKLARGENVDFKITPSGDQPDEPPSATGGKTKEIRVRLGAPEDAAGGVSGEGTQGSGRQLVFPLPVPVPVVSSKALRL
jgi:hypothetical protein